MIGRLIEFAVAYVAIGGGLAWGGWKLLRLRRAHERQGEKNAREREEHKSEVCFICDQPINPAVDCFEKRKGWYHDICLTNLGGART